MAGQVTLRVTVNDDDLLSLVRQHPTEIESCCRFPYTAFVVEKCDLFSHIMSSRFKTKMSYAVASFPIPEHLLALYGFQPVEHEHLYRGSAGVPFHDGLSRS